MGVHGLWKLLETSGKPVPLESLDNKILAVDVSIWLHQLVKGFQDSRGSPLPNAHLLGLFHRVCKLLFYRIKPVFVFDGGVPLLKRQTIAARKKLKSQASQDAARLRKELLKNLIKRKAVRRVLQGKEIPDATKEYVNQDVHDIFHLPPASTLEHGSSESELEDKSLAIHQPLPYSSESDSEIEHEIKRSPPKIRGFNLDLHTLDVASEEFLSLPPDVRHDILSELKETRKQNSWGKLHEMPGESSDFSSFQLGRLIKRRNVQVSLEQAEKEMGGKVLSLSELQDLMSAQGVSFVTDETSKVIDSASRKIASDSSTRYLLLKESPVKEGTSTSQELPNKEGMGKDQNNSSKCHSTSTNDPGSLFYDNWSSDEEMIDHISHGDALANAIESENDDLSQEQILALITSSSQEELARNKDETSSTVSSFKQKTDTQILSQGDTKYEYLPESGQSSEAPMDISDTSRIDPQSIILSASSKPAVFQGINLKSNMFPQPSTSSVRVDSEEDVKGKNVSAKLSPVMSSGNKRTGISFESNRPAASMHVKRTPLTSIDLIEDTLNSSHDSDCDDFEEVEGEDKEMSQSRGDNSFVTISNENCDTSTLRVDSCSTSKENSQIKNSQSIEIIIKPKDHMTEGDIFADIFSLPVTLSSENEGHPHNKVNLEPKNLETSIGTESVVPKINTEAIEVSDEEIYPEKIDVKEKDPAGRVLRDKNTHQKSTFQESSKLLQDEGFLDQNEAPDSPLVQTLSPGELQRLEDSLQEEGKDLQTEKGRQERLATSITEQMCSEAQELLQLFGLPFIVAPLEAEAQCAFLDSISLTEGTITDDSDIWLFGGKKVYKNFFNQKKHVLQYTSSNIKHYFKLSREQLVQLALLVGSDYTVGLQGIGPVTALEIVAAFSSSIEPDSVESLMLGLKQFRNWCKDGCPLNSPLKQKLKTKLKNVKLADGFPNQAVVEAYLRPTVDDSRETFSWGSLDLPALRDYARQKFGWTASKTDEILLPVAKRWSLKTSQKLIDSYFNLQPKLVQGLNKMSKRVQRAIHSMSTEDMGESSENDVESTESCSPRTVKRKHPETSARNKLTKIKSGSSEPKKEEKSLAKQTMRDLPVRAPTEPRNRTSQGVKRVGLHRNSNVTNQTTSQIIKNCDTEANISERCKDADAGCATNPHKSRKRRQPSSSLAHNSVKRQEVSCSKSDSQCENVMASAMIEDCLIKDSPLSRKEINLGIQRYSMKTSTQDSSAKVENRERDFLSKSSSVFNTYDKNVIAQPSTSGIVRKSAESCPRKCDVHSREETQISDLDTSDEDNIFDTIPKSCSKTRDGSDIQNSAAVELEIVSALNWQEDPWQDNVPNFTTHSLKPKLYFGGIRSNRKAKKSLTPMQQNTTPTPALGVDSRGLRPGWRTEQQLQSRDTVWIEAIQTKKEEVIPQRERDRRALEQAKTKAIEVIKASDSRQASRFLGGVSRTSNKVRRRLRCRPNHKELPEHNLSESSSDE